MSEWKDESERAAIDKIVKQLRQPVQLDPTFDVRVMSAVHAEALAQCDAKHGEQDAAQEAGNTWWRRTYTLRFSPVSGLAMAASIFGVMFLGATMMSRANAVSPASNVASLTAPAPVNAAPVENVHFILVDGSAKQVWLVGDFNGWAKKETPLVRAANGSAWTVAVPLSQGRHEYAFVVADENGERWVADPLTRVVEDEFGTESSVVRVEPSSAAAAM